MFLQTLSLVLDIDIQTIDFLDKNCFVGLVHSLYFTIAFINKPSKIQIMETLFIEARYTERFRLPKSLINLLPNTVTLVTTIQFLDSLEEIKLQLEHANKRVLFFKGEHSKYPGQVLGCSMNKQEDTELFLYIGTGEFHPKALLLKQNKPVFSFNPFTQQTHKLDEQDVKLLKNRQNGAILKYKVSENIGIIVSTKPGQHHLKKAEALKQTLISDGKNAYIFITNTLNFEELENFPFIECWVNTMCPRIGFDDVKRTEKVLININEI